MALFRKNKDVLECVYGNLKGLDNYVGGRVKIKINDDLQNIEFIDEEIERGKIKHSIKFSDLYSVSRFTERALPAALPGNDRTTADFIFITKIDYSDDGVLKSITVQDPALSNITSKRVEFTQKLINRVPSEKPKLSKDMNNSMHAIEAIKGLKELLDMGAITEEEFNIKKKDLLNI